MARADSSKPWLIACKTTIGYGTPTKAGKASTHGSPLGADEIAGAREKLGWAHPPFEVPAHILAAWRACGAVSSSRPRCGGTVYQHPAHRAHRSLDH